MRRKHNRCAALSATGEAWRLHHRPHAVRPTVRKMAFRESRNNAVYFFPPPAAQRNATQRNATQQALLKHEPTLSFFASCATGNLDHAR